ncbi:MAG: hypothetical protein MMC33_004639 [Icmadophila ericetorum]|nr:hypothetical protein [Icmadophila ericetorum]
MDHQKQKETALCEELIGRIQSVLDNRSREWQSYLPTARAIIVLINGLPSPLEILGVDLYMEALTTIQRLVYQDADNGAEMDVVLWCERHWTILLERSPDNYKALRGHGHAWLLRSQETLARIYRDQRSSSDETSLPSARTNSMNDSLVSSHDYVQARDLLRPSLESFDRAIEVADSNSELTGELLALGAEAYINFGNVSSPRTNDNYYQKAIHYLQSANVIEGFSLDDHLKQFLDDNSRYLD